MLLINRKQVDKKFNVGGLFKKFPLNRRNSKVSQNAGECSFVDSKDGDEENATTKILTSSGVEPPSITVSPQEQELGTIVSSEAPDQVADPIRFSNNEERYTSFTSECISLQNSEMTLDIRSKLDSNFEETLPIEGSELELSNEENDLITYITDTYSDINYNPHLEESANDYSYGGYHPVCKGEVYFSQSIQGLEYITLRKLGWGHFSTVWLAKVRYNEAFLPTDNGSDTEIKNESYVALKFVKSNKHYLEATEDETNILKTLNKPLLYGENLSLNEINYFKGFRMKNGQPIGHPGHDRIMRLLDNFEVNGPNGHHICMVFELLGESALNLIYKYKLLYSSLKASPSENPFFTSSNKFAKWDPKNLKKNTKSMLTLGLKAKTNTTPLDQKIREINSNMLIDLIAGSKNCGGLPLHLVKQTVKQLLVAVDYMHHCGVIHTDLKPENILVQINDIDKILKSVENSKVSKSKNKGRKESSTASRKASMTSSYSNGSYQRSKNSFLNESPIRASKPLELVSFNKDIFQENQKQAVTKKNGHDSNDTLSIKIADLGNATFTKFHFTDQIQTRQYRSPEIILKYKQWGSSTDLWSIGCIIFELITGDFLFDPHEGKDFDKDDDHLAQIIELLGEFPSKEYLKDCDLASKYFVVDPHSKEVSLKNIDRLKFWSLQDVLVEKYKFEKDSDEVILITDLILKCLKYNLEDRFDSHSLLKHPWLQDDIKDINLDDLKRLRKDHSDLPGFTCATG
ncbi:uncharacterized protein PRCAT00005468001 [Priceomyces carsonii]|uniref:uncharacterized protein n=1 Tax=Priceomyces carsonii TaxID=28549 RepID=UPI002ED9EC67|nr:unnamed protein product [Priceomyces carsonii]